MNLNERIFEATAAIRARAAAITSRAIDAGRDRIELAATRVESAKGPFETLALAGQELTHLAQRHTSRFIDQNVDTVKGALVGSARRLRVVSKAQSVKKLLEAQKSLSEESRMRLRNDAKATWSIVSEASKDVSALALNTYATLVTGKVSKLPRTTAVRTAKKRATKRAS